MIKNILNDKNIIFKSIVVLFIVNIGNAISLCIQILLSKNLDFQIFGRGITWVDCGTVEDLKLANDDL